MASYNSSRARSDIDSIPPPGRALSSQFPRGRTSAQEAQAGVEGAHFARRNCQACVPSASVSSTVIELPLHRMSYAPDRLVAGSAEYVQL